MSNLFQKLDEVLDRYNRLTEKLADPTIYDRQKEFKETSTERSNLEELVQTYTSYKKLKVEIQDAKDMLMNEKDQELKEMARDELGEKEGKLPEMEDKLKLLLLPKDPLDDRNVMMEIRAGAGGDEASIFVGEVFRMYQNYFKKIGFKEEIESISQGDEGLKEIIFSVSGDKVYSKMKYEGYK